MKKLIITILSVATLLSITGCGNNAELDALRKENDKLHQELEANQVTGSTSGKNSPKDLKQIEIGEIVSVQTEVGVFEIQIDNIHKTDMYDDTSDVFAATIQCVVNNISYSSELHSNTITGHDLADNHNYIQLTDTNGIAFPFYDISGPTDGAYAVSHTLPVGSVSRESYPFLVPVNTTDVLVIINNQYVLTTTISD